MPGPGPSGSPEIAWRFEAEGGFHSSPVVVSGLIIAVSDDGVVHAVDLPTGKERWTSTVGPDATASPLVVSEHVIVSDGMGWMHAIGITDGLPAWKVETDGAITGSPASDGRLIVAATHGGSAYGLDADTGSIEWQVDVGGTAARSVALADGIAYLGISGEILALSLEDGEIRWRSRLARSGDVSTPTVTGGRLFAATGLDGTEPADYGVGTADSTSGAVGWRYASPAKELLYTPAVVKDRAYVVGHDRALVALDVATGEVDWSIERDVVLEALPAVVGNVVYIVGNNGDAEAIDAVVGTSLWTVPIEGVPFSPAVIDGYLVVGTNLGHLYAIGERAR